MSAPIHLGLSGFAYKGWQGEGRFYPPKLKAADYLAFYGTRFDCLELDGTWYRAPSFEAVAAWDRATPGGFQFSPKMHRRVTHMARLLEEGDETVRVFLGRMRPLAEAGKLGPILVQLPPNLAKKDDRLERFLARVPYRIPETDLPVRYAFEFRNDAWRTDAVLTLLDQYGCTWVASDAEQELCEFPAVGGFHYVRLRRDAYSVEELEVWAKRFAKASANGRPVTAFCKHEDAGSPWEWADSLRLMLGA
jgi:uncharacterized protein YecE (DUF72 family)